MPAEEETDSRDPTITLGQGWTRRPHRRVFACYGLLAGSWAVFKGAKG